MAGVGRLAGQPAPARHTHRFVAFAESRGYTILDLAFGWLLGFPSVASVIAGARSVAQVTAHAEAARWRLTPADMEEVSRIPHA